MSRARASQERPRRRAPPDGAHVAAPDLQRRALLVSAASALLGAACKREERPGPPRTTASGEPGRWRELHFPAGDAYPEEELATVLVAKGRPLLVALHGRGEAGRGLEAGARGWRDEYELGRADERLRAPPLRAEDLLGLVRPERLAHLNESLRASPFEGLCVACPYCPVLADASETGARPFGRFVTEQLLPTVRREVGCAAGRTRTGIDGVSMGGRLALLVGLSHPEQFASIGALQPAVRESEAEMWSALARRARSRAEIALRLVTSDEDFFRPAVEKLSERLRADGVAHELLLTPGPHDYVYNRGPGSFEMLLWHERVLRGLAAP